MKKVLIIIVFAILMTGCSTNVNFQFPKNDDLNIKIYSYENHKNVTVKECSVKSQSEKYTKIEKLLNSNSEEWSKEFASILPHIVVSNSKFTVIFSGTRMLVNQNKSQYSHAIKSSDYIFLNCD